MARAVERLNSSHRRIEEIVPAEMQPKFDAALTKLKTERGLDCYDFARRALENLLAVGEEIQGSVYLPTAESFQKGLLDWLENSAHGAAHSYDVYTKSIQIKQSEVARGNSVLDVKEGELFIRAVLHDIAEFMPVFEKNGVEKLSDKKGKDEKMRRHDWLIARMVKRVGAHMGVEDAQQLAVDLRNHDYYWSKPSVEGMANMAQRLSPAGKVLAEADRLAGIEPSSELTRNRHFSLGFWYFLRPDLQASDRAQWKLRTGGLFDGMSAVLTEFVGQDHWYYTETGRELNREKKHRFQEELIQFYTEQYRTSREVLEQAKDQKNPIEFGLRARGGNDFEKQVELPGDDIEAQIQELLRMPVSSKESGGREYYGYSIRVTTGPDTYVWLDPSILKFPSIEALTDELLRAVHEYEQLFIPEETT